MRREFWRKLADEPRLREHITLIPGSATSFDLAQIFPAALLSGAFDHLLDDAERLDALRNLRRHLRTGGVLVFDLFLGLMKDAPLLPAGVVATLKGEVRRFVGGRVLSGRGKETYLVFEIYEAGELVERIEERSPVGVTTRDAVHGLLKAAGFTVRHEWGDYDFSPYRDGDALLIVEAVKR
jgi:SAM-dependent methyltransferase